MTEGIHERPAQSIVLVRAFEEADADGVLLTGAERREATERAREAGGEPAEMAARRADALARSLAKRVPALSGVRGATRIGLDVSWAVLGVAVVVGLATNALGPERRVNVLSFPLMGLVAWNLLVYSALVAAALRRGRRPTERGGALSAVLGWLSTRLERHARLALPKNRALDPRAAEIALAGLTSFLQRWRQAVRPLLASRTRLALHLGAAGLAVGLLAGMYVRGLTFEYRASWESTFLDVPTAGALLETLLAPASALTRLDVPTDALEAMRAPGSADNADVWIHLWAATALLFVVLPRVALATREWWRQHRLARALPVDPLGGPFRMLAAPDRGAGVRVTVLPYSATPEPRAADALRALLQQALGLRATVWFAPALEYGAEPDAAEWTEGQPHVVVFALVQTPEEEVHGAFARALVARGGTLACLVDGSAWRARFGADDPGAATRRAAWDRVLREAGAEPLHVDLGRAPDGEAVDALRRALGPEVAA